MEKERERNIDVRETYWLPPIHSLTGIEPTT